MRARPTPIGFTSAHARARVRPEYSGSFWNTGIDFPDNPRHFQGLIRGGIWGFLGDVPQNIGDGLGHGLAKSGERGLAEAGQARAGLEQAASRIRRARAGLLAPGSKERSAPGGSGSCPSRTGRLWPARAGASRRASREPSSCAHRVGGQSHVCAHPALCHVWCALVLVCAQGEGSRAGKGS